MIATCIVNGEETTTETGDLSVRIANREDDPRAESIVSATTAATICCQANGIKLFGRCTALCGERLGAGVPRFWCPTDALRLNRCIGEAATVQVFERRLPEIMLEQNGVIEADGAFEHFAQSSTPHILCATPLI